MPSRSGFSIRRLISTRRPRSKSEGAGRDPTLPLDFFDDYGHLSREEEAKPRVRSDPTIPAIPTTPRSPKSPRSLRSLKSKSSPGHRTKTKKAPQPIVVMGRSGSVHRISGPLPPLPDTPHSSASSLCSCDCRGSPRLAGAGTASGSSSPGLCSSRSGTPEEDSLHSGPFASYTFQFPSYVDDASSSIYSTSESDINNTSFLNNSPDSATPLDLLQGLLPLQSEAQPDLQMHTQRDDGQSQTRTRVPTGLAIDDASIDGMSANMRQLIRETDQAFQAVGTAITEARLASQSFSAPATPSLEPVREPSQAHSPPASPHLQPLSPRETVQSPRGSFRKDLKSVSSWNSPVRKSSVSKAKRRKSKKSRRREQQQQQQQRKVAAAPSKTGARWTLPENVSGLLNGRLFHRIEADEMLTPSQLQEWKQNRLSRMQSSSNQSTETLKTIETDSSDTPVEPFHLEDLPTRIGAAGVRMSIPSPIAEVDTPRTFDFGPEATRAPTTAGSTPETEQGQGQVTQGPDKDDAAANPSADASADVGDEESGMTIQNMSFPSPPQKSPLRLMSRRQLPSLPLPTIPEVTVASPAGDEDEQRQGKRAAGEPAQLQPEMKEMSHADDFIFFDSTPYSMTMPSFRHGPIRFSKADVHLLDSTQLVPDETLDWTAFQMAILGGAGDFFSDSVDFTRLADADEVDELAVWFEDFGFAGAGGLVDAAEDRLLQQQKEQPDSDNDRTRSIDNPLNKDRRRADKKRALPSLEIEASPPSPPAASDYSPVSSSGSSTVTVTAPATEDAAPGSPQEQQQGRRREMVQIQSLPIPVTVEGPPEHPGGLGIRRWTAEGHPKKYLAVPFASNGEERKGSVESLPQSPMLELVVNRGIDGDEYLVPMGYNLGHDLGDFLKWESENVYAAGFFGSD